MDCLLRRFWRGAEEEVSEPAAVPKDQVGRVGPLLPCQKDGKPRRTVGLVALGLAKDQMGELVAQLAELESELDLVPLILTDMDDFEILFSRAYVFEHFPSPRSQELAPAGLPWDVYLRRRIELLQRKWQPVAMIPFGERAAYAVRTWRAQSEDNRSVWQESEAVEQ